MGKKKLTKPKVEEAVPVESTKGNSNLPTVVEVEPEQPEILPQDKKKHVQFEPEPPEDKKGKHKQVEFKDEPEVHNEFEDPLDSSMQGEDWDEEDDLYAEDYETPEDPSQHNEWEGGPNTGWGQSAMPAPNTAATPAVGIGYQGKTKLNAQPTSAAGAPEGGGSWAQRPSEGAWAGSEAAYSNSGDGSNFDRPTTTWAPPVPNTKSGWKNWGEEAKNMPKYTHASQASGAKQTPLAASRGFGSPQQQAQALQSLLSQPTQASATSKYAIYNVGRNTQQPSQSRPPPPSKQPPQQWQQWSKKEAQLSMQPHQTHLAASRQQSQSQYYGGTGDDFESMEESEADSDSDDTTHDNNRRVHFTGAKPSDGWGKPAAKGWRESAPKPPAKGWGEAASKAAPPWVSASQGGHWGPPAQVDQSWGEQGASTSKDPGAWVPTTLKDEGLGGGGSLKDDGGWAATSGDPWGTPVSKINDAWASNSMKGGDAYFNPSSQSYGSPPQQMKDAFSSKQSQKYSMPSRTFAYASRGETTPLDTGKQGSPMSEYADIRFVESNGEALASVQNALYGRERLAKDRIHWMFPSDKDERVSSLLAWIEAVSYNLGAFGLHKFLQTRDRGALFANADYRPTDSLSEPAFEWLNYDDLQPTMDRTLQESVAFYDPAVQVIVFVCLPSKTGNSMAMWRRKIKVPNNLRLAYQAELGIALSGLRREKDYVVHVDVLPSKEQEVPPIQKAAPLQRRATVLRRSSAPTKPSKPSKPKAKRKWWQIFG